MLTATLTTQMRWTIRRLVKKRSHKKKLESLKTEPFQKVSGTKKSEAIQIMFQKIVNKRHESYMVKTHLNMAYLKEKKQKIRTVTT